MPGRVDNSLEDSYEGRKVNLKFYISTKFY